MISLFSDTPTSPMTTMPWKCIDCKNRFYGPTNRAPANGCPKCGSKHVFDINVTPVSLPKRYLP